MDKERDHAGSSRLLRLVAKFRGKNYRDNYVAAHTREVLAQQMRNFRGALSQAEFAEKIGKQKTVVARLENPAYSGWTIRTMHEIARKLDVAVFCRFVDFPTFVKYSSDFSAGAFRPAPYDEVALDDAASRSENEANSEAMKGLLSGPPPSSSPGNEMGRGA